MRKRKEDERRNWKRRTREGWHRTTRWPYLCDWPRALWRDYHGHYLIVTPRPENKRIYDMYMDGHYKGCRNTRRVAKRALECAARNEEIRSIE